MPSLAYLANSTLHIAWELIKILLYSDGPGVLNGIFQEPIKLAYRRIILVEKFTTASTDLDCFF